MTGLPRNIFWGIGLTLLSALVIWLFRDHVDGWVAMLGQFSGSPWALLVVTAVFLAGSFVLVPQWALIAAAVAGFGLVEGGAMAWFATLVAATVHYTVGRLFEARLRTRLAGGRLERAKAVLTKNSFWSGFVVRFLPSGPALFVNSVAGLLRLNPVGFLAGTGVGIVPKILLTGFVVSELISSAQGRQIGLGLAVAVGSLLVFTIVIRLLRRQRRREPVK